MKKYEIQNVPVELKTIETVLDNFKVICDHVAEKYGYKDIDDMLKKASQKSKLSMLEEARDIMENVVA
tara:strand:- start:283 stop:486 length:204 start_codon:yes stop_codon:yes gene_type:complete